MRKKSCNWKIQIKMDKQEKDRICFSIHAFTLFDQNRDLPFTHRVMAASEHSQHGRGQLREEALGHLVVCVCDYMCDWGATFSLWFAKSERTVWKAICANVGQSYLPLPGSLPLPGGRGVIRRRFVEWTARLAGCPQGTGWAYWERHHWTVVDAHAFRVNIDRQMGFLIYIPTSQLLSCQSPSMNQSDSWFQTFSALATPHVLLLSLLWPSVC